MTRKEKEEKEKEREAQRKLLLKKYGGEDHLQPPLLRDRIVLENEVYVEYDESGAVKGAPKAEAKSKYAEDVYINNHTSVWGSWWANFQWGYACCHSTVKNSYCTGEEGKSAFAEAEKRRTGGELEELSSSVLIEEKSGHSSDVENGRDPPPVDNAETKGKVESGVKKRTLTEMKGGVTEEELEQYKRSRAVADDPMAKFLGKDELVH